MSIARINPAVRRLPGRVSVALVLLLFVHTAGGIGLTPQSPEVKKAVDKAAKYLETHDDPGRRVGASALSALALLKNRAEHTNPVIVKAQADIAAEIERGWLTDQGDPTSIYAHGLCAYFLVELDPEGQKPLVRKLVDSLVRWQKPHGGWGYPYEEVGDTSMTQYAVLGLWIAGEYGVEAPDTCWVKACNWLIRTQDPDGSFAYHPVDPGHDRRVKQAQSYIGPYAVTAGAAGALYLCQDAFGLRRRAEITMTLDVHDSLKHVPRAADKADVDDDNAWRPKPPPPGLNTSSLSKAITDADHWMQQNYTVNPPHFVHYYLYALERYETVRTGGHEHPRTVLRWYDDGARMLIESQKEDGSWLSEGHSGIVCDTAFSMLFLLRSMKRTIDRVELFGDGLLVGGRGLPAAGQDVRLRLGTIVPRPLKGPAEDLLSKMEDGAAPEYLRAVEGFEELALASDPQELNKHAVKLRALARAEDPAARRAAVRALGRTGDLDQVPTLIYALTDPDPTIARVADDALRMLTRKFDGVGNELNRNLLVDRWKAWFRGIRPDARLED